MTHRAYPIPLFIIGYLIGLVIIASLSIIVRVNISVNILRRNVEQLLTRLAWALLQPMPAMAAG